MKICLVAPGIMPIPPPKWGAVEMMLWDYLQILQKMPEIQVSLVNTPDRREILKQIHSQTFDIVHIHYDVFVDIAKQIFGPKVIVSSHYPFINVRQQHKNDNYEEIFSSLTDTRFFHIFASSVKDINTLLKAGAESHKVHLSRLGVRKDDYAYQENPEYDKTLCFSQIVDRKRQYHIQGIEGIVFSGRLDDAKFKTTANYLGELPRDLLNSEITKYSNFVLLSKVENTTPLAVKEALLCGLGVVVSEDVAYELDDSLPFITVLSEKEIEDLSFVEKSITHNKKVSVERRQSIREYAISRFDLTEILKNEYIPLLKRLKNEY